MVWGEGISLKGPTGYTGHTGHTGYTGYTGAGFVPKVVTSTGPIDTDGTVVGTARGFSSLQTPYTWAVGQQVNLADQTSGSTVILTGSIISIILDEEPNYEVAVLISKITGTPASGETSSSSWLMSFAGQAGPTGYTGYTGPFGASIIVAGTVALVANLPTSPYPAQNTAYVVVDDGHVYVSNGLDNWADVGKFIGATGFTGYTGHTGHTGYTGDTGTEGASFTTLSLINGSATITSKTSVYIEGSSTVRSLESVNTRAAGAYVQFTVSDANMFTGSFIQSGLWSTEVGGGAMVYGIRLNRDGGALFFDDSLEAEETWIPTDTFAIYADGATVTYFKNGSKVFTSPDKRLAYKYQSQSVGGGGGFGDLTIDTIRFFPTGLRGTGFSALPSTSEKSTIPGEIVGTFAPWIVDIPGAFAVGDWVQVVDKGVQSELIYTGKISDITPSGLGYEIMVNVISSAGMPDSGETSTSWSIQLSGNIGFTGYTGPSGNTILSGQGGPAEEAGSIGDFYFDLSDMKFYGPKTV